MIQLDIQTALGGEGLEIKINVLWKNVIVFLHFLCSTGELGYDGPLYDGFLHMTDNMLGPSPMHIKYMSYVYDGFCI